MSWSPATSLLGFLVMLLFLSTLVWSQGQNFPGGNSGLTPSTPGIPSSAGRNIFYASNYGVKAGGYKFCDGNVAASSSGVITIGNDAAQNDPSLVTIGLNSTWIVWVSTWNCSGYNQLAGVLIQPGTGCTANSATQMTCANLSSGTCGSTLGGTTNKCTVYAFPYDDTAAVNTWITAMSQAQTCGTGVMPSGLFLVRSFTATEFAAGCAADNTGNFSWPGLTVEGIGYGSSGSVMVHDPTLNVGTCPTLGSAKVCDFGVPASASFQNDLHLGNFSIDYGGNETLPGATSNSSNALNVGANSTIFNVTLLAGDMPIGVQAQGSNAAPVLIYGLTLNGMSNSSSSSFAALIAGNAVYIDSSNIEASNGALAILGGNPLFGQTVTNKTQIGYSLNNAGLATMINVPANTVWVSKGDYFQTCAAGTMDYIQVSGTLDMSSDNFVVPVASSCNGVHVKSGGLTFNSGQTNVAIGSTGTGIKVDSGGIFQNQGSILNTSTTPYSISGTFLGAGVGQTTAVTAAKLVLSAGWGSTAANTALSGANAPIQFTITNSGTGQAATPTITYTFPTPYAVAPISCTATQLGGTNPSLNPFTSSSLTAAGVTFTATGTPTVSDTEIMQITCVTP